MFLSVGFLKTGAKGSAQGNFGLMDLVAGLHWLRENLPAFGGDPERVTIMGHGTGAALANFLAVSPVARGKYGKIYLVFVDASHLFVPDYFAHQFYIIVCMNNIIIVIQNDYYLSI